MRDEAALSAALRRERAVVLLALLLVAACAWSWLLLESRAMSGTAMPDMPEMADMPGMEGMDMGGMQTMAPHPAAWSAALAASLFAMWLVMMIGMMTPSVAPVIHLYLGVARKARQDGHSFASGLWFFAGYLLAWGGFSLLAAALQWLLQSSSLMSAAMQTSSRPLGGSVLLLAGIYQWLPAKDACLSRCRAPLAFIQHHGGFPDSAPGGLRLGLLHGLYCVGCCWLLMLLLLVFGVMNLLWVAGLMLYVLAEKLAPHPGWLRRASGVALVGAAAVLLLD